MNHYDAIFSLAANGVGFGRPETACCIDASHLDAGLLIWLSRFLFRRGAVE